MGSIQTFRIGLIIGTTRVNRIGPEVADFILNTIKRHETSSSAAKGPKVTMDRIDLKEDPLPMFNEPGIPRNIKDLNLYKHERTREWARRIASNDAFIFLSAQRNWGIPAELKNAIDYLYWEWHGKPVGLITYGGHGGEQCQDQLRTVLNAMGVKVQEKGIAMVLPKPEGLMKAFNGEKMGLDAGDDGALWSEHREEISQLLEGLTQRLVEGQQAA